ncbi:hypothetical protein AVEN_86870-1 [Araneus ventricosus]|uniref:Uncharacterized protein n=1 Tax=Araneus ventricosus TaxID=182803 RepID=A0A4Y2MFX0_ARAVE|nr:hypothetical protein AVEN_86870-1 [Araneus ventricosus]
MTRKRMISFQTFTSGFQLPMFEKAIKIFSMLRQLRILLHKLQTKSKVPLQHQQCHQLMSRLTTHQRQMFSWTVLQRGVQQFQQARDKFLDVPIESDVLQRDLIFKKGRDMVSKTCATQVNCNRTRMVCETLRDSPRVCGLLCPDW